MEAKDIKKLPATMRFQREFVTTVIDTINIKTQKPGQSYTVDKSVVDLKAAAAYVNINEGEVPVALSYVKKVYAIPREDFIKMATLIKEESVINVPKTESEVK